MSMAQLKPRYTIDQYLEIERASKERHIYLDGEIYAMAGESDAHGDITVNLVAILHGQLLDRPCRVRTKDTKVRSGPTPMAGGSTQGMFSYPDVAVICGEREYHDAFKDIILNPTAIMEVMSPSTEIFDRGEKFARYRAWNPTLSDFILISQERPQVEHYTRQQDGKWTSTLHEGLSAEVVVASIGCTLKLADVYRRVTFPSREPLSSASAVRGL